MIVFCTNWIELNWSKFEFNLIKLRIIWIWFEIWTELFKSIRDLIWFNSWFVIQFNWIQFRFNLNLTDLNLTDLNLNQIQFSWIISRILVVDFVISKICIHSSIFHCWFYFIFILLWWPLDKTEQNISLKIYSFFSFFCFNIDS